MNYAIILASGTGSRIGEKTPKQFIEINGKTILEYTIEAFEKNENTDKIILVAHKDYLDFCKKFNYKKIDKVVEGGKRRQDSSKIGVDLIKEDNAKILIHDGARPFVTNEIINNCYKALDNYDAINTGIETTDTIVVVENGIMINTLDRNKLISCQTPQGFKSSLIKKAHALAIKNNIEVTDDVSLITKLNLGKVFIVKGDSKNIKITHPKDMIFAKENLK